MSLTLSWLAAVSLSLLYPALLTAVFSLIVWLVFRHYLPLPFWLSLWAALAMGGLLALFTAALAGLFVSNLNSMPQRPQNSAFRLAHLNCLLYTTPIEAKLAFTRLSKADVVVLNEVRPELLDKLADFLPDYPHQLTTRELYRPAKRTHRPLEMAVLSRWPLTRLNNWTDRLNLYRIDLPTGPLHLLHIHPSSPYNAQAWQFRNHTLAALTREPLPAPLIVVGDINTVPWDPALNGLKAAGLKVQGPYLPTFPQWVPLVPIDLILTSPDLPKPSIHRIRVKTTDHLGLIADFGTIPSPNPLPQQ